MIVFGDYVLFNQEYRSCKPKTVSFNDKSINEIWEELDELGIETETDIKVKEIHTFSQTKKGIYLGLKTINLSIYYEWYDSIDVGVGLIPEKFVATRSNFIKCAEIRCKGIQKTYYVPIQNVIKN